jgi:spore germination protein GerM
VDPNWEYIQEKSNIVGALPNKLFNENDMELIQKSSTQA